MTLYRQEGCSCCATYADYLEENGFTVRMTLSTTWAPSASDMASPTTPSGATPC